MKAYEPEKVFDENGKLVEELKELAPTGNARLSANPVGNGGLLRKALDMPNFRDFGHALEKPGVDNLGSMEIFAKFLTEIIKRNPHTFRLFGPDETESNKLGDVYSVTDKVWMADGLDEDKDGGHLAPAGRVMEILSEHTVEGWLEGYLLTGRHGLLNSYEPFIHIIDSMVNQHAKWLEKCQEINWREDVSSLNILLTSTVWRQVREPFLVHSTFGAHV